VTVAAAQQNVGLDTDAEHFFYAVLGGLGFQFAGAAMKGTSVTWTKSVFSAPSSRRI